MMLKRSEIRVRDPYVVLHEGTYYLYCTTGARTLSYYVSDDLEHWELGGTAFEIPDDSMKFEIPSRVFDIRKRYLPSISFMVIFVPEETKSGFSLLKCFRYEIIVLILVR